jgi:hypothetical protein
MRVTGLSLQVSTRRATARSMAFSLGKAVLDSDASAFRRSGIRWQIAGTAAKSSDSTMAPHAADPLANPRNPPAIWRHQASEAVGCHAC